MGFPSGDLKNALMLSYIMSTDIREPRDTHRMDA